ncbi:MAG: JAB domain-containing protein [Bacilli bacterium]
MNIEVPVLSKTDKNIDKDIKVLSSTDIVNLEQVQAIKNAVKEHLLFIGLDRGNNIRNISILGIGSNCEVLVDSKDIIRTALLSCSERVVLVHNHPSNNLEPSNPDIHITNVTNNLLKTFHIELLDHIIVTEKDYISMEKIKKFNKDYTNDSINEMTKGFLIEENKRLKQEIEMLKNSKKEIENTSQEDIDYDYE